LERKHDCLDQFIQSFLALAWSKSISVEPLCDIKVQASWKASLLKVHPCMEMITEQSFKGIKTTNMTEPPISLQKEIKV
jgi:hypothetical protein